MNQARIGWVLLLAAPLLIGGVVPMNIASDRPQSAPLAKSQAEARILDVLDDLDRNHRRGMMNVCVVDGRLLRLLAESIDAHRASLARENFARAGVDSLVTLVEGDAHEEVTKLEGPIDPVFLGADKSGDVDYLAKLLPLVRPGGLIVALNMRRPQPDPAYIEAVTTDK